MYIIKTDYRGRINTDLLNQLLFEDEFAILQFASKTAEDTILSMAGTLYDVPAEMVKSGNDRNYYVLSMAINIALYNIYQRADDEQIPAKIIKNYDDTLDDLIKISNGKMSLSLAPASTGNTDGATIGDDETAATSGKGLRRIGSAEKRTHHI